MSLHLRIGQTERLAQPGGNFGSALGKGVLAVRVGVHGEDNPGIRVAAVLGFHEQIVTRRLAEGAGQLVGEQAGQGLP
ncbi:hypothetical protein RZS08_17210, partial [Arthrospira platensis SPKY1]|nr:hypothetical protein [Arthrospira platensis SPKY1]